MRLTAENWKKVFEALSISENYYAGRLENPTGKVAEMTSSAASYKRVSEIIWAKLPKEVKAKLAKSTPEVKADAATS